MCAEKEFGPFVNKGNNLFEVDTFIRVTRSKHDVDLRSATFFDRQSSSMDSTTENNGFEAYNFTGCVENFLGDLIDVHPSAGVDFRSRFLRG